ncbi:CHC2 zinc finger domain-containing protein [Halobacillus mangrovi]|uniref:Zinc finger CHC2-type domain-containing protein n=1 Tax=Halobacillus mangrovi TaxID=402384 RepID=A0A1W5ZZX1_9BACI|nr:CHC2 zinc finger domain-containing protein [Halobacillus mangrovi]ARI78810.1 hypothetical protein HM131_19075 [Halobacillus mangrovi]
MSIIDHILDTVSITDALERYENVSFVNPKSQRKRFNIRCPYHNDRNPSFTVYTETNTFRC